MSNNFEKNVVHEDVLIKILLKTVNLCRRYKNILVNITIVILVLCAGVIFLYFKKKTENLETRRIFNKAKADYEKAEKSEDKDFKSAINTFDLIIKKYPRSPDAEGAMYFLGHSYYKLGKYRRAKELYRKFLNKYPNSYWRVIVRRNLGYCLENKKKYDEAVSEYLVIKNNNKDHFLLPLIDLDIARCYEALGKKNEAKKIYTKLDLQEAKDRLSWINLNTQEMTPIQARRSVEKHNRP